VKEFLLEFMNPMSKSKLKKSKKKLASEIDLGESKVCLGNIIDLLNI
jgi:hypothetical protein